MGSIGKLCLLFFVALGLPCAPSSFAEEEPASEARRVLVLTRFDPEEPHNEVYCHAAQIVEMPLNYFGITMQLWNVDEGLPPDSMLAGVRAVITWFDDTKALEPSIWPWLAAVRKRGLRIVHLQSLAPLATAAAASEAGTSAFEEHLKHLGMRKRDRFAKGLGRVRVLYTDRALHTYEADPTRHATHNGPTSYAQENRVWMRTQDRLRTADVRTPVVSGPWGGIALEPWVCNTGLDRNDRRLYLDLFAFLREALGLQRIPAPDPSMRHGRRKFFIHVDGDGFESISTARSKNECCGKVWEEEICDRFGIPMTLSVIVASLTKEMNPDRPTAMMQQAVKLLNRPEIEVASHTVTHPFVWHDKEKPHARDQEAHEGHGETENAYAYAPPRGFTPTFVNEVRDSIKFIDKHLLKKPKRCEGMLWSGNCTPPKEAILEATRLQCWNLNGGGFRVDPAYNSIGYVSPWARVLGDAVQVYACAANENHFPGFFTTNPGAFHHIGKTLERTARDRILRPANIYAHFYSVERAPRLDALKKLILRWAFTEETIIVVASDYVNAVSSARRMSLSMHPSGCSFTGMDNCKTLRFDDEARRVDFSKSQGVVGQRVFRDHLYVDVSMPKGRVVLSKAAPSLPHLVQSNHPLQGIVLSPKGIALTSVAAFDREVILGGFAANATIKVDVDGKTVETLVANDDGRVRVKRPKGGPRERIEVHTR